MSRPNVRLFDVLKNSVSGELGSVIGVEGDKVDLVILSGAIVRFKYGEHFAHVPHDEAVAFRAEIQAMRRAKLAARPKKSRKRKTTKV